MAERDAPSANKQTPRYALSPLAMLSKLLKDYFFAIVGAALIAVLLRVFVIEAFRIPTDFMAPALLPGDLIFVDKLAFSGLMGRKKANPKAGDVVVFSFPNDPTKDYIKRVIGVAGDEVRIQDSKLMLNGKIVSQSKASSQFEEELEGKKYVASWAGASAESKNMVAVKVPEGSIFVLGDNRAKGQDSRGWGFLPLSSIKGKASLIWFSVGASGGTSEAPGVRWARLFKPVR